MELNEVLRTLKKLEAKSIKKGYRGDAAGYAFKRFALIFLNKIAHGKKKNPSDWNLFVADYLKKGKTIKEAAKDWEKKTKKA